MRLSFFWLMIAGLIIAGCSGGNVVTPTYDLAEANGNFGMIGVMGVYDLTIDPVNQTADLVAKRTSSIGESYIVSGLGFFTAVPCADCFGLITIDFVGGNLALIFGLDHPFPAGNISEPPTAANRLDLDVFDVALVIAPQGATATNYVLTGEDIYEGYVANASGYTTELAEVTGDGAAMPFVLVIDDSLADPIPTDNFNKLAMGAEDLVFSVGFSLAPGMSLSYDTYLTMGYGWSAAKLDRLNPKYYNPEFNRKAAWKVVIIPPDMAGDPPDPANTWNDEDSTTTWPVAVEVYDWQIGAVVASGEFGDAAETEIFAASEVASVTLEIPGMNTAIHEITALPAETGLPGDPLVYMFAIANELDLDAGVYIGLVKVTDERETLSEGDGRDYLIDSPDGLALDAYDMPEYATYQVFTANVLDVLPP